MKIKSLAYLFLVSAMLFGACTEGGDNTTINPGEQPSETPGEDTEGQPEEQPGDTPEDIVVKAKEFAGEYFGDAYTPDAGTYTLIFSDKKFEVGGGMTSFASYYILEVYADFYTGEDGGVIPMPEGTYTLDKEETMAKGTISWEYSTFYTTGSNIVIGQKSFDSAELVVTAEDATLTAVIDGVKHIVTYNGQADIVDKRPEDKEVTAQYAWAYYYADNYSKGLSDCFYLYLSDIDNDCNDLPNASYYALDLYSEILEEGTTNLSIPYGTYRVDANCTREPNTIGFNTDTKYYVMNESGTGHADSGLITGGTVVIDESGITAKLEIMNIMTHTVTFTGTIIVSDFSNSHL